MRLDQMADLFCDRSPIQASFGVISLLDPEQQLTTLKLIDERQDILLEDLDRLNQRIVNIIEVYSNNRSSADDSNQQDVAA